MAEPAQGRGRTEHQGGNEMGGAGEDGDFLLGLLVGLAQPS